MNMIRSKTVSYLRDLLKLDTYGISETRLRTAVNQSLMNYLPFMYGMVAFFFLGYALLQWIVLREPGSGLMVGVALVSAAFMFGGMVLLRRHLLPTAWAEPLTAVGAALVLVNIVLRAQLTLDPKQAANLALFLFAVAIIFVSPLWYLLFSVITLLMLALAIATFPPSPDWPYFVVVILAAMATGLLAHVSRVRAYRHTVVLRMVEAEQRRELERRAIQLQTAVAVGQRITSILEHHVLWAQITQLIQQKYKVYYVALFLPDTDGRGLTAVAQSGVDLNEQAPLAKVGLASNVGWVWQHGRVQKIDDVQADGREPAPENRPQTRSDLAVPLKWGDRVLGVLNLQSDLPAHFRQDAIPAYQLLADQISIALENARLYGEVKQFNQELEQKVAERTQALQAAYNHLERLDKTKSDFITIASHELRTPLTIVNFNSQMFLEDEHIQQNSEYQRWAEGIHRGVARMEAVVSDILDVAKIDNQALELHMSPLNVRFLVQQVVQRLQRTAVGRHLSFTVGDLSHLPEIEADAEALEKLLQHLLVNAVKYTPDGGSIEVYGRLHQEAERPTAVELIIADTGIGIAPEVQQLIFEKFFQLGAVGHHSSGKTSFKGGGSGIGLAIARGIAEAHNGRVWVESEGYDEGRCPGSAFHVLLPIEQSELMEKKRGRAANHTKAT